MCAAIWMVPHEVGELAVDLAAGRKDRLLLLEIPDFENVTPFLEPVVSTERSDAPKSPAMCNVFYSPVAICVPIAQGYPTWGGSPFGVGKFGYTDGDKAADAVVYTLVPGEENHIAAQRHGRELRIHNSPFAEMYDVIKYADTVDELDANKATTVTISRSAGGDHQASLMNVVDLLTGASVPVSNGAFSHRIGPDELAIFEIK